ncbi:hypothetical protein [Streptomyces sp. TRM68416]|uniref:hypothetical protein n=1 Tax=Streptomyces sp. TRM68416 TaxID=2758412 RepID=UPI001661FD95|nr:hypothetical protein [Streptomyces sp. TRM68416]MBD0837549.1 hypothetical protein [Streptomyces sp. TRM68416]
MKRSFKVHGAIAGGASALLLSLAALTCVPGVSLPEDTAEAAMGLGVLLLFPVFVAAVVRGVLTKATKSEIWSAFRCLPGNVQLALGALTVAGFALAFTGASTTSLQNPEVINGRYYAYDTAVGHRGRAEVSREAYETAVEGEQRTMLSIPGLLFAAAAYFTLATGELRRADAAKA